MIFQPTLDKTTLSLNGTRYFLRYANSFTNPDDPSLDESHIHSCYELYMNVQGDVSFLANNHIYPIRNGDIIFTRPNDVHICLYNQPTQHEHFCLWIYAEESSPLFNFTKTADFQPFFSFDEETRKKLIRLLHQLYAYQEELPEPATTSCLLQIFTLLNTKENQFSSSNRRSEIPAELQKILNYLNEHFAEVQKIADLQDKTYTSPATLNRWFKKYLHLTPHAFLEAKKLSYAKQLLQQGESVLNACTQAGFIDCSRFIHLFKKKFGCTPLQYKHEITSF